MVLYYWANVDQVVNSAAEDFSASFICGLWGLILTKPIIRHNTTNIRKNYSDVCIYLLVFPKVMIVCIFFNFSCLDFKI